MKRRRSVVGVACATALPVLAVKKRRGWNPYPGAQTEFFNQPPDEWMVMGASYNAKTRVINITRYKP